jgi:serine/threonine protein phosphatase 1
MKRPDLFAIGDIHGNIRALDDLLTKIRPELSAGDVLVFLGDYIDRGPNARECVARIIELQETSAFSVVTLLGNHEDWMLKSYRDHRSHSWIMGMESFETIASYSRNAAEVLQREIERYGVRFILENPTLSYEVFFDSVPSSHMTFFLNLKPYYRANGVLCVHGGVDSSAGDIHAQPVDTLIWGTDDFPEAYSGGDRVVYGHHRNAILDSAGWPHPNIKPNGTYGIDTSAQGVLTAIRFPDVAVFQSEQFLNESADLF